MGGTKAAGTGAGNFLFSLFPLFVTFPRSFALLGIRRERAPTRYLVETETRQRSKSAHITDIVTDFMSCGCWFAYLIGPVVESFLFSL